MGCGCSSAPGVASDVPNRVSNTVPEELVSEEESFSTRIQRFEEERDQLLLTQKAVKNGGGGVKLTEEQELRLEELRQLLQVM